MAAAAAATGPVVAAADATAAARTSPYGSGNAVGALTCGGGPSYSQTGQLAAIPHRGWFFLEYLFEKNKNQMAETVQALWAAYQKSLREKPLATKAITRLVILAVATNTVLQAHFCVVTAIPSPSVRCCLAPDPSSAGCCVGDPGARYRGGRSLPLPPSGASGVLLQERCFFNQQTISFQRARHGPNHAHALSDAGKGRRPPCASVLRG